MSFNAQLEGLSLSDILQIISSGKLTGIATIIQDWTSGKLVFSQGNVVYATTDSMPKLGYILVHKKLISDEDLKNALKAQTERDERMPLATLLVAKGYVDKEVLEKETTEHIRTIFNRILTLDSGMFHFQPADISDKLVVLRRGLNTEALLINAAVSSDHSKQEEEDSDDGLRIDREICDFSL